MRARRALDSGSARPSQSLSRGAYVYLGSVGLAGAAILGHSISQLFEAPFTLWWLVLAVCTLGSSRFSVPLPKLPVTLSVSEVFVFIALLAFGPGVAALILSADGLLVSLSQRNRKLRRALFNITEPAVSMWLAGSVFFALAGIEPFHTDVVSMSRIVGPIVVMAGVYSLSNTLLTAVAMAVETGASVVAIWRKYAGFVSLNCLAGAALAALVVGGTPGIELAMLALVMPVLAISYLIFKVFTARLDDAERHVAEVNRLYLSTIEALAVAVDARDQITHDHIRRVQEYTVRLARALGVTDEQELKALRAASLLHDVGKIAIPDHILNKPGPLSDAEREAMKRHTIAGAEILSVVDFPYPVVPVVRHHHEAWDGSGYPDGLAGTTIPVGARILSVVDCFDAVTSDRPYRGRMSDADAIQILRARRGTMYDPLVVDMFLKILPELRPVEGTRPHFAPAPLSAPVRPYPVPAPAALAAASTVALAAAPAVPAH